MPAIKRKKGRPEGTSTSVTMLSCLTGSQTAEAVLLFIAINGSGFAAEIERIIGLNKSAVFAQLRRMENAGLLSRQTIGRAAVFSFSRQPIAASFGSWVEQIAAQLSPQERQRFSARRKSRASGKKLSFGNKMPEERT
jgi:hypothetical protein